MSFTNRQLLLKTRPEGLVSLDNFDLRETPTAELADGQALVRVLYLSMDPTNRVWMSDVPQYMPPVAIGEVMRSLGVGRVVALGEKRDPGLLGQRVTWTIADSCGECVPCRDWDLHLEYLTPYLFLWLQLLQVILFMTIINFSWKQAH